MRDEIEKLAALVLHSWKKAGFAPGAFPEIALDCLRSMRPLDMEALGEWVLTSPRAPRQRASESGALTLYWDEDRRFVIEAIMGPRSTPALHRPLGCGALALMSGLAVHATRFFQPRQRAKGFAVGRFRSLSAQLLRPGAIVPLDAEALHGLFEVGAPTVSLVARALKSTRPGWYYPPRFALVPSRRANLACRYLDRIAPLGRAAHESFLRKAFSTLDLAAAIRLLMHARARKYPALDLAAAISTLRRRHGALAEELRMAVAWQATAELIHPNAEIPEEDRFLLSLLSAVGVGEEMFSLIAEYRPGEPPLELLQRWLTGLALTYPAGRKLFLCAYACLERAEAGRATPQTIYEQASNYKLSREEMEALEIWCLDRLFLLNRAAEVRMEKAA